jgi:hypothetical protein
MTVIPDSLIPHGISDPNALLTTRVSNNLRRKEKSRRDKMVNKLVSALAASDDELSDKDDLFKFENKRIFAWLEEQPICHGLGFRVAANLIRKAHAVGTWDALENWKIILGQWRANGSLIGMAQRVFYFLSNRV